MQEYSNLKELTEASERAVKAGVHHVLLTVDKSGKLELKGTPSLVETLSTNKQLLKGLKGNIYDTKKGLLKILFNKDNRS